MTRSMFLRRIPIRRLSFLALAASAVCAVAFSPGPEILHTLTVIALSTAALCVLAVPWLTTFLVSDDDDILTGHGHMHSRADGLRAGGRHGAPRTIAVLLVLAVWALIISVWSRIGHAVTSIATSAGHALARTNTSAQPLPS